MAQEVKGRVLTVGLTATKGYLSNQESELLGNIANLHNVGLVERVLRRRGNTTRETRLDFPSNERPIPCPKAAVLKLGDVCEYQGDVQ